MLCNQCPRRCNALRDNEGNMGGFCQMPSTPVVARAALHFWEEPSISGTNGSGTIFFSGCSLHCVFCQNSVISSKNVGKMLSVNELADLFKKLEDQGAHNINLVTPTHFVDSIIKALDIYKPDIPIVYNSGGYENVETLRRLNDYIDVYLLDFKYINNDKATLYSNAPEYPQICKNALLEAYHQQPICLFKDDIIQKGIIVRHLLMPQATSDAIEIFNWTRENLPNAYFSIMSQYLPLHKANDMPKINRKITQREYDKVVDYIAFTGFENCYIQDIKSADKDYIPNFDFTGI